MDENEGEPWPAKRRCVEISSQTANQQLNLEHCQPYEATVCIGPLQVRNQGVSLYIYPSAPTGFALSSAPASPLGTNECPHPDLREDSPKSYDPPSSDLFYAPGSMIPQMNSVPVWGHGHDPPSDPEIGCSYPGIFTDRRGAISHETKQSFFRHLEKAVGTEENSRRKSSWRGWRKQNIQKPHHEDVGSEDTVFVEMNKHCDSIPFRDCGCQAQPGKSSSHSLSSWCKSLMRKETSKDTASETVTRSAARTCNTEQDTGRMCDTYQSILPSNSEQSTCATQGTQFCCSNAQEFQPAPPAEGFQDAATAEEITKENVNDNCAKVVPKEDYEKKNYELGPLSSMMELLFAGATKTSNCSEDVGESHQLDNEELGEDVLARWKSDMPIQPQRETAKKEPLLRTQLREVRQHVITHWRHLSYRKHCPIHRLRSQEKLPLCDPCKRIEDPKLVKEMKMDDRDPVTQNQEFKQDSTARGAPCVNNPSLKDLTHEPAYIGTKGESPERSTASDQNSSITSDYSSSSNVKTDDRLQNIPENILCADGSQVIFQEARNTGGQGSMPFQDLLHSFIDAPRNETEFTTCNVPYNLSQPPLLESHFWSKYQQCCYCRNEPTCSERNSEPINKQNLSLPEDTPPQDKLLTPSTTFEPWLPYQQGDYFQDEVDYSSPHIEDKSLSLLQYEQKQPSQDEPCPLQNNTFQVLGAQPNPPDEPHNKNTNAYYFRGAQSNSQNSQEGLPPTEQNDPCYVNGVQSKLHCKPQPEQNKWCKVIGAQSNTRDKPSGLPQPELNTPSSLTAQDKLRCLPVPQTEQIRHNELRAKSHPQGEPRSLRKLVQNTPNILQARRNAKGKCLSLMQCKQHISCSLPASQDKQQPKQNKCFLPEQNIEHINEPGRHPNIQEKPAQNISCNVPPRPATKNQPVLTQPEQCSHKIEQSHTQGKQPQAEQIIPQNTPQTQRSVTQNIALQKTQNTSGVNASFNQGKSNPEVSFATELFHETSSNGTVNSSIIPVHSAPDSSLRFDTKNGPAAETLTDQNHETITPIPDPSPSLLECDCLPQQYRNVSLSVSPPDPSSMKSKSNISHPEIATRPSPRDGLHCVPQPELTPQPATHISPSEADQSGAETYEGVLAPNILHPSALASDVITQVRNGASQTEQTNSVQDESSSNLEAEALAEPVPTVHLNEGQIISVQNVSPGSGTFLEPTVRPKYDDGFLGSAGSNNFIKKKTDSCILQCKKCSLPFGFRTIPKNRATENSPSESSTGSTSSSTTDSDPSCPQPPALPTFKSLTIIPKTLERPYERDRSVTTSCLSKITHECFHPKSTDFKGGSLLKDSCKMSSHCVNVLKNSEKKSPILTSGCSTSDGSQTLQNSENSLMPSKSSSSSSRSCQQRVKPAKARHENSSNGSSNSSGSYKAVNPQTEVLGSNVCRTLRDANEEKTVALPANISTRHCLLKMPVHDDLMSFSTQEMSSTRVDHQVKSNFDGCALSKPSRSAGKYRSKPLLRTPKSRSSNESSRSNPFPETFSDRSSDEGSCRPKRSRLNEEDRHQGRSPRGNYTACLCDGITSRESSKAEQTSFSVPTLLSAPTGYTIPTIVSVPPILAPMCCSPIATPCIPVQNWPSMPVWASCTIPPTNCPVEEPPCSRPSSLYQASSESELYAPSESSSSTPKAVTPPESAGTSGSQPDLAGSSDTFLPQPPTETTIHPLVSISGAPSEYLPSFPEPPGRQPVSLVFIPIRTPYTPCPSWNPSATLHTEPPAVQDTQIEQTADQVLNKRVSEDSLDKAVLSSEYTEEKPTYVGESKNLVSRNEVLEKPVCNKVQSDDLPIALDKRLLECPTSDDSAGLEREDVLARRYSSKDGDDVAATKCDMVERKSIPKSGDACTKLVSTEHDKERLQFCHEYNGQKAADTKLEKVCVDLMPPKRSPCEFVQDDNEQQPELEPVEPEGRCVPEDEAENATQQKEETPASAANCCEQYSEYVVQKSRDRSSEKHCH